MDPMIFKLVNGHPLPLLAHARDGTIRVPDGVEWFDAADAAAHVGMTEEAVRELWRMVWRESMPPRDPSRLFTAEQPPSPGAPETAFAPDDLASLHQLDFEELNDAEFDCVMRFCRRHQIDPWARMVWAEVRWDPAADKWRLVIRMRWQGIRAIAHRTGEFIGNKAPRYTMSAEDPRRPETCTVVVYREVNGVKRAFRGVALYEDCYAGGEWWERRPLFMLRKAAEIDALRLAFPEVLGDVHEREEADAAPGPRRRRRGERPRPGYEPIRPQRHGDRPSYPAEDFGGPRTEEEFEAELVGMGLHEPQVRGQVVARLEERFPRLRQSVPTMFFKRSITELRSHPTAYGLSLHGHVPH